MHKGKKLFILGICQDIKNLLYREVSYLMGKVIKVDQVQNIFNQVGYMKSELMKIHLREDKKLFCVTTARRILFPLLPKVKPNWNIETART